MYVRTAVIAPMRAFVKSFGVLICASLYLAFWAPPASSKDSDPVLERLSVAVSEHPVAVWSRRPAKQTGIVVLVHGRTWGARTAFDFETRSDKRSLLKALASAGYSTYAVDLPGYGESPRDASGWLTPSRAAEVVEAVLQFARQQHPAAAPPILLGWSRGSKIAALVASRGSQPLGGLVLYAFNFDPQAPPLYGPASGAPKAMTNSEADARSDFISPQVIDADLIQEFVSKALRLDPKKVDVCCDAEFLGIRPESIHVPTLMIYGARDPGTHPAAAAQFFSLLSSQDRRWVVIGSGDHAVGLEATAPIFFGAVIDFIRSATPSANSR